jgi:hypothetical protein
MSTKRDIADVNQKKNQEPRTKMKDKIGSQNAESQYLIQY